MGKFLTVKLPHEEWEALQVILLDVLDQMKEDMREYEMGVAGHKGMFCDIIITAIERAKEKDKKPKFKLIKPSGYRR